MEIELGEDEYYIRDQLGDLPKQYQQAYALLVAERLAVSLKEYLPEHWVAAARVSINEAWAMIEGENKSEDRLALLTQKLDAEEIGLQENLIVQHIIRSIRSALRMMDEDGEFDKFIIQFHHLISVIEQTAKNPARASELLSLEFEYLLRCCEVIVKVRESGGGIAHELLLVRLPTVTHTLLA